MSQTTPQTIQNILTTTVYIDGAYRPFGELTPTDTRARADELRAVTGWGPTARVGPVAMAWRELSMALEHANAANVAALETEQIVELAPRLWITPPGGGLLG
jgi:hypothetical protein